MASTQMVVFEACECQGQPPHSHRPTRFTVRLNTGVTATVDSATYELNKNEVVEIVATHPPYIEWWEEGGE